MSKLTKIILVLLALAGLVAACNDEQDSIGWEPEVATPLAQFEVDFNEQSFHGKKLHDFARMYFSDLLVTQNQQNEILYTAISQGLDDSIKKWLPPYLQVQVDDFVSNMEHDYPLPAFTAAPLMMDLLDHFAQRNSVVPLNKFSYYTIAGLPTVLQNVVKDSLYHLSINVGGDIGLDIKELTEKAKDLRWLKLQMAVNTRLAVNAQLQVYLRDTSGVVFDSLFREKDGRHEGQMPFANNVAGEYKQRVTREYPDSESAKDMFNRLHTLSLEIKSDSLCLDTGLLWLKDLYNRKLHTSVGLQFKSNLDSWVNE
ncbi:MAG: hypothetical protein LBU92_03810 [Prevotellaceae bacterium]|jgi:hypothetical protein|nr:hypothetical protein [Prevotellaceae bacterium]